MNGLTHDASTGTISATTPEAIAFVRATVIASGAALYLNAGIRPNRAYTPTAMKKALNEISGSNAKSLKAALTDYVDAAAAAGQPVTMPTVLRAIGRG